MKKIIYIFSAALLCLVSCSRENVPVQDIRTTTVAPKEGDFARATFYVTVPEAELHATLTRAWNDPFAEEPKSIADGDLFVAVFGKGTTPGHGGQLQHLLKARLMKDFATENPKGTNPPIQHNYTNGTYVYAYEVLLPISEEALVLDFFAGAFDGYGDDAEVFSLDNPLPVDYEDVVMPLLLSKGGNAAYWQRVEIGGVYPKPDTRPGHEGEYVIAQILDDDGEVIPQEDPDYEADDIEELHNIRLIRNFAKVTFTAATGADFTLNKFYLVDTPKYGTVAPFSGTEGYANIYTRSTSPTEIMNNYKGYILSTELNSGIDGKTFLDPGQFEYMYERTVPDLNKPYGETGALLDVTWNTDSETASKLGYNGTNPEVLHRYYKVAFIDEKGAVPIVRNIVYNFQISAIIADTHYDTAAEAYRHEFLGDISANIATSMLDEITNQKSLIKVSEMSKTFIGKDNDYDISFWFYPDVATAAHKEDVVVIDGTTYQNQRVTIQIAVEEVAGHSAAIASFENTTVSNDEGTIHVVLNDSAEGAVKKSKLKILGQWGTQRALYREVEFTVMEKQEFKQGDIVCTVSELTTDAVDQDVTVTIALPNELPRDIFPLQIMIEPQNNGLRAISKNGLSAIPVKHGVSAFNEEGQTTLRNYYFVKTITFDEYAKLENGAYNYTNTFYCYFKTCLTGGESGPTNKTKIRINDFGKEYFIQSEVELK